MKNWNIDNKKIVRYFGMPISAATNSDACRVALEHLNSTKKEALPLRDAQRLFIETYQIAQRFLDQIEECKTLGEPCLNIFEEFIEQVTFNA